MKRIIVFCLVFITIFSACKKENSPTLPGKWTIENTVVREYVNNMLDDTYTEQGDGTKIDFQNNGHVVITYPDNSVESFPYTLLPDSKVNIDGEIYEIRNLASKTVTLFIREDYLPGEYSEISLNLKR
jgi:hypothetical protein